MLNLGTAYDFVDSLNSINRLDANIAKGFAMGTNGSQPTSRANGEQSFWKMTAARRASSPSAVRSRRT